MTLIKVKNYKNNYLNFDKAKNYKNLAKINIHDILRCSTMSNISNSTVNVKRMSRCSNFLNVNFSSA